jgi:hypothetical protein
MSVAELSDQRLVVLHPILKAEYFRMYHWEQGWIENAKEMVCTEFDLHYASRTDGPEDQDTEDVVCLHYLIIHRIQPCIQVSVSSSTVDISDATNWVKDFDIPDKNVYIDELADYLAHPLERTKVNPLQWWWEKCKVWPCLSQMALDYLCIPSTLYIQHVVASVKAFITATSTSV